MPKRDRDNKGRMTKQGFAAYRRKNAEIIGEESIREFKRKNIKQNPDTEHRLEIQNEILKLVNEGKGRIEILKHLNVTYPDSKLAKYFSSYIDNHIKKINKQQSKGISR